MASALSDYDWIVAAIPFIATALAAISVHFATRGAAPPDQSREDDAWWRAIK